MSSHNGRNEPSERSEASLAEEAFEQLHDLDDRRDAAQMRVEELVREPEFEETSHGESTRASVWLFAALALVVVLAAGAWALMRTIAS